MSGLRAARWSRKAAIGRADDGGSVAGSVVVAVGHSRAK